MDPRAPFAWDEECFDHTREAFLPSYTNVSGMVCENEWRLVGHEERNEEASDQAANELSEKADQAEQEEVNRLAEGTGDEQEDIGFAD
ncbi:hypothetical protein A1O7_01953 [Cladophialophora yegresii CBS 114405]|uniref:Uncharacterized protein n=1 Tax=Cladophialophora yegresii CBS 114405 TaxID=1182544 RepID=W9W960_9EURO|nr:uncharacterized protein A1O7_01953 [Cladophialophora yegresii CBS 114405]EXJ61525.1 hypothetical protein A1O7_01953 [Cladophialophora yegresii CBS 114405]